MFEFNEAYMLKVNPSDTDRVYMVAKKDKGLNIVLIENERN